MTPTPPTDAEVEAAARAICATWASDWENLGDADHAAYVDAHWKAHKGEARAALLAAAAVRERG